jgi:hypothetical protein
MTLQEILKAKGLSDDDVQSIIGEMKQNKIFTAGEENLDIRYNKLKGDFDTLTKQHGESTTLIEQLKKDNAGNEGLQTKITEYEGKVQQLEQELQKTKVDAALKVALLEANVTDVDYLSFKIREKGEVKLGDDGKIKGIDDTIAALKTQFPQHFASESKKKIDENKLPEGDDKGNGWTKKELLSKPYNERLKMYQENPEAFNQAMQSDN